MHPKYVVEFGRSFSDFLLDDISFRYADDVNF